MRTCVPAWALTPPVMPISAPAVVPATNFLRVVCVITLAPQVVPGSQGDVTLLFTYLRSIDDGRQRHKALQKWARRRASSYLNVFAGINSFGGLKQSQQRPATYPTSARSGARSPETAGSDHSRARRPRRSPHTCAACRTIAAPRRHYGQDRPAIR